MLSQVSCKYNRKEELLLNRDLGFSPKDISIVYYHTGECSFCYGVLQALNISFPETQIISVTQLRDTSLLSYQLEGISFKGYSIIDSTGSFERKNEKLLHQNNLFLINGKNEILASDQDFDISTRNKFKRLINDK